MSSPPSAAAGESETSRTAAIEVEMQAEEVFTNPEFTRVISQSDELEILPLDSPEPIKLVRDPQIGRQFWEAMTIDIYPAIRFLATTEEHPEDWIPLSFKRTGPAPMDFAFTVFGHTATGETEIGSIIIRSGGTGDSEQGGLYRRPCPDGESFVPILRSSIEVAKQQPDIVEIWDGELVFPPIKLKPPAPATSTAPSSRP